MIDRRRWSAAMLGGLALSGSVRAHPAAGNILRIPFVAAETSFDPARAGDLYSNTVIAHIFEPLYHYDPLANPVKLRPLTAAAMPVVEDDFRVWTVQLARGIHFPDDPAFGGRPRELVAQDFVYAMKRFCDPATASPSYQDLAEDGIVGLEALRTRALQERRPLDYDADVAGLRALDRYTLQIRLAAPRPRFIATLAGQFSFAVAREVVEHYGDAISEHPVGTGPYRLKEWRRSSRIVLERNPQFRELHYDAEPADGDIAGQALLARFKGRRLPLNDGVEIAVIEESQPRWLAFMGGELDWVRVPAEFADYASPADKLAPNLARRGIEARKYVNPDYVMTWFNMDDPVVGGYAADKVALRRAISLAYDIDFEIRIVRHGQALAAQAPMPPGTLGYDPNYRSENSLHDPARAKALLDLFGYVDRDGDGWRELPDGRPLVLQMATQFSEIERRLDESWERSLRSVGIRIRFQTAQWPENFKAARAGKLQMWSLASTNLDPDAQPALAWMYGPGAGDANLARFRLPAFDALYRRMSLLPDGPERNALFVEASKLVAAYMPYKIHVHRIYTDLSQPWIRGYRQPLFHNDVWQYVEVDAELRERLAH